MRRYRLSDQAFDSLADIGEWSEANFGKRQADRYIELLVSRCNGLAAAQSPSNPAARSLATTCAPISDWRGRGGILWCSQTVRTRF